jgi:transcriptional regulator with XRE-family HTH domain
MDASSTGERVSRLRKLRGLTQQGPARTARLSLRTIKTVEADEGNPRLETLHAIARALHVQTSNLTTPGQPEPDPVEPERWEDVRAALYQRVPGGEPDEPATVGGVLAGLAALMPAWRDNQYTLVRNTLPALIRDALSLEEDGRVARSRVLNATAWMLIMTRQFDDAMTAGRLALDAGGLERTSCLPTRPRRWRTRPRGRWFPPVHFAGPSVRRFAPCRGKCRQPGWLPLSVWGLTRP